MVKRGDVWWAEIPDGGRRPVLILTRDAAIPKLRRVVCVPATRTMRRIPSEMLVDESDGMPSECVFSFDNIETISQSLLTTRICSIGIERDDEICETLGAALGC